MIIAHRGSSGYRPEETYASWSLAAEQNADFLEADLVLSKDGELFCLHSNELSVTTDVSSHPEFAARYTSKVIDHINTTGWFSEDFTAAEIKTLRCKEAFPFRSSSWNGLYNVPTFQEFLQLSAALEAQHGRVYGLYIETKSPTHFLKYNLTMEEKMLKILEERGFNRTDGSVFIQSFETQNLRKIKRLSDIPLIQLLGRSEEIQSDSGLKFSQLVTPKGLQEISSYAYGIGPSKTLIMPISAKDGKLSEPTTLVRDAHKNGLKVHPYTFRNESRYYDVRKFSSMQQEIEAFFKLGVDGVFTDFPDIGLKAKYNFLGIDQSTKVNSCTSFGKGSVITIVLLVVSLLATVVGTTILYRRYMSLYRYHRTEHLEL